MTLSARPIGDARDAQAVAGALRHHQRWAKCGLTRPPDLSLFDGPVGFRWPSERDVHVSGVLVFGTRDGVHGLVGVGLHTGWQGDHDRTRIGEVVILDERQDAKAIARAAIAAMIVGGAAAVRLPGIGLAASIMADEARPQLEVGDVSWIHVARAADLVVESAEAPVSINDLDVLGAYGTGNWPVRERVRGTDIVPEIHDPSTAHMQLIKSSKLLRPMFYGRAAVREEVDVVIVGGGIAGFTAAYALQPRQCLVLEREARLGGTARVHDGPFGRIGVGAHYEHDPDPRFAPEILELYQQLGIAKPDASGRWGFVDTQHYIDTHRHEQSVRPDGSVRTNTWQLFEESDEGAKLAATMLRLNDRFSVPTRLADPELRELADITFGDWLRSNGCMPTGELARGIDVILRSDYATGVEGTNAYAGLHYFLCRPYLTGGSRTWAPPEGLTYVVDRLLERTPNARVATQQMVRRIEAESSGVTVEVLDLVANKSYRIRANAVVFAAPKRQLKYLYPVDAPLFRPTDYASWVTVTCAHDFAHERELLCWTNHTHDENPEHIGFTWVNHAQTEGPVVLGHYVAFDCEPHALVTPARTLIRKSLDHTSALVGGDASRTLRNVRVEKFGHAMPMPRPGTLFFDANARRHTERVVYAGVDTGRLPIMSEAFDSGLEAARALAGVR